MIFVTPRLLIHRHVVTLRSGQGDAALHRLLAPTFTVSMEQTLGQVDGDGFLLLEAQHLQPSRCPNLSELAYLPTQR